MIEIPKYTPPEYICSKKYHETLKKFNKEYQNTIREALKKNLCVTTSFAIATTGSDGRYEKGPVSELELIIFYDEYANSQEYPDYIDSAIEKSKIHAKVKEFKNIDLDMMSRYENNPSATYPSRVIDSAFIIGDFEIFHKAKQKLVFEFNDIHGKSIYERVKTKKNDYIKSCKTGTYKFNKDNYATQFSTQGNISYYDPNNNQLSFKNGPLRAIQLSLVANIIKYCRTNNYIDSTNLISQLPTNTREKIQFLDEQNLLSITSTQSKQLGEAYSYFLWTYTAAQESFQYTNNPMLLLPKQEVKEHLKNTVEILSMPLLK